MIFNEFFGILKNYVSKKTSFEKEFLEIFKNSFYYYQTKKKKSRKRAACKCTKRERGVKTNRAEFQHPITLLNIPTTNKVAEKNDIDIFHKYLNFIIL